MDKVDVEVAAEDSGRQMTPDRTLGQTPNYYENLPFSSSVIYFDDEFRAVQRGSRHCDLEY